jgi:hypothetical protein
MISETERLRRDRAIALLRAFAVGKLTNDEFEARYDANLAPRPIRKWEDRALWALKTVVWHCYDDLSTHRLEGAHALTPEGKKCFARWILFLQTNRHYEWQRHDFIFGGIRDWFFDRVTFGWWTKWRRGMGEEVDWEIWPFRRPEDFASARIRPRRH